MKYVMKVIMAILMLVAIYVTFKYRVMTMSAIVDTPRKTVIIDAGHGGMDPGKVGAEGVLEKDINLLLALELKEELLKMGYQVVLTRDKDMSLGDESASNKKIDDMKKRCGVVEEYNGDIMISIHQNSFSDEKVQGAQVFYYKYSDEGKKLAKNIQDAIRNYVDENNLRVEKDNTSYYLLVHTKCPTVICECSFLSNAEDMKKICDKTYRKKMAEGISLGIRNYFEN